VTRLAKEPRRATKAKTPARTRKARPAAKAKKVVLLSGGNPQISKGDGDAPVQAYIRAMPGWKRAVGERLDAIVEANVPDVRKAVKWNTPFYGVEGRGFFFAFHVYARYVQMTFFKGTSLDPMPAKGSKHPEVRYHDIHEGALDETQVARWVRQAAALPGWIP